LVNSCSGGGNEAVVVQSGRGERQIFVDVGGGYWIRREAVEGDRISIGIDELLPVGISAVAGAVKVAGASAQLAEVSATFCLAENRELRQDLSLAAPGALIGTKNEGFVFDDGRTYGAAKNISLERGLRLVCRKEVVPRIQDVVPKEFESRS